MENMEFFKRETKFMVQAPPRRTYPGLREIIASLNVGDSILVPDRQSAQAVCTRGRQLRPDWKLSRKAQRDGTIRIWRIK